VLIISFGGMAGVMGPEVILAFVRRRFVSDLRRGTPDALDLLVVCSEAGMALESALERVSQEMRMSNRAMASVLAGLLDDLRVLPDRREAFTNLGTRSGLDGLKRVGTMLSQSLQYGTPLSRALRAVAEELRRERMNRLEENAVKLPAQLIFPLILFIMPSLYIVLLGPSFMKLYDALHAISHSLH
jgi:tight adherence protein C